MPPSTFFEDFRILKGAAPFPWQERLFAEFSRGHFPACTIPTGLGKTSVIAVWLIALARKFPVPLRLAYIVNRRTVVDQTTTEVTGYRDKVKELNASFPKLAVSTLRGQLADNEEWFADPSCPAVICGTVDLIGSALLFSSYRAGRSTLPLHAGFLGQDVLLVHDEAHLEQPFQSLIEGIRKEQYRNGAHEVRPFHVMPLTATPRNQDNVFTLNEDDTSHAEVAKRIHAKKVLRFHTVADEKKETSDALVKLALDHQESGKAILVFVRTVADAKAVVNKLEQKNKDKTALLVGTLRGYERDRLAECDEVFARFQQPSDRTEGLTPTEGTVYLVATSAGEVGVNITADHMVCDLTPIDSMAQRLGRVNRFGDVDAWVDVVVLAKFDGERLGQARQRTLDLLKQLPAHGHQQYRASPSTLGGLYRDKPKEVEAASTPKPDERIATDILFDAWALTTIRDLPGRPEVAEFLHGVEDEDTMETLFAWREEVGLLDVLLRLPPDELKERVAEIGAYLDEYELKPHELLRERSYNARAHIKDMAKRAGDRPAWVIDTRGAISVMSIEKLTELEVGDLAGRTVVLPLAAGGLRDDGTIDGKAAYSTNTHYDVADVFGNEARPRRVRFLWSYKVEEDAEDDDSPTGTEDEEGEDGTVVGTWKQLGYWPHERLKRPKDENATQLLNMPRLSDIAISRDDEQNVRRIVAFVGVDVAGDETRSRFSKKRQELTDHLTTAEQCAAGFVKRLDLPPDLGRAVTLAAKWHDLGKERKVWQNGIGNFKYPGEVLAKSGHSRRIKGLQRYRHEFGSLVDLHDERKKFHKLLANEPEAVRELVLHLIAAHHGRGRPHFTADEACDNEAKGNLTTMVSASVPLRYARLQRKYGRWGLAYLESLVRAADYAASGDLEGQS